MFFLAHHVRSPFVNTAFPYLLSYHIRTALYILRKNRRYGIFDRLYRRKAIMAHLLRLTFIGSIIILHAGTAVAQNAVFSHRRTTGTTLSPRSIVTLGHLENVFRYARHTGLPRADTVPNKTLLSIPIDDAMLTPHVLANMRSIEPGRESDLARIVDLFERLRRQDDLGFDPANRAFEEDDFRNALRDIPSAGSDGKILHSRILVYRDRHSRARGYIRIRYFSENGELDVYFSEVVVEKSLEGSGIAKALVCAVLQDIERSFGTNHRTFYLHGTSNVEKIYAAAGIAVKAGFHLVEGPHHSAYDARTLVRVVRLSSHDAAQSFDRSL